MPEYSQRIPVAGDDCGMIIEKIKRQQSDNSALAETLPPEAYNSDAFFSHEMEKIFRGDWVFVGHVSQIPALGDYFTLDIVNEPLVVVRNAEGVSVMSAVCLHRWAPVVSGQGNCKAFVCPFHNWTYDITGNLIGTPYMNQAADFDRKQCRLPVIRSEIVHGMIFITFSEQVESIAQRLKPLNALLDKYQVAELDTAYTLDYDCPFNWKMAVETFMECYHHSAVHRTTLEDSFPGRLSYIGEDGPGWTLCHQPLRKNGELSEVLTEGLIPLTGFSEEDMRQIHLMLIYPGCLIGLNPDRLSISTLLPINKHMTVWHRLVLVSKASSAQPSFAQTAADMKASSLSIIDEDLMINSAQQRGSASQLAGPGRLGHLETTVWHLANYIRTRI
ncbi:MULTISPECIES: aromatic ring-hydroxylating oxygenase subunit alpha [Sodalis]|jgi:phenylpropionate dioxygenase-like ring-hydroxylating dioxygenase large terminal subunit|uniref:Phenylpropionate dioxygenase-like ring-hydroxylating dioxygenase large terminal subunit n=1 Tax=Sodalis ligni TaxID=2697027 RepID=A0A4R1NAF1_9GAMM|nr:aromatic ring-hydroxylating dioxygenase subunit alpha [Sodalis ligni]TCL04384.1 phenylpropionate dioxygenase-like ring-hydroxylating dioxygenase large terminal subunit [Sodalis ligni]